MKHQRGDFSRNSRLLFLSSLALLIGGVAAVTAKILLLMITLFTNIFYYGEFNFLNRMPSMEHWGAGFIAVPIVGGLIIGLMARFGTEKIRGHGIPEALEAILIGKSIMQPKVAILKPLSSAISIGSGGPFGAEGPIIMTGGAVGSIFSQFLQLTSAERKTLLVAGAAAGMSAVFNAPLASLLLAVELLLFEWKPRSVAPVALASCAAAVVRTHIIGPGALFITPQHLAFGDRDLICAAILGLVGGAFSTLLSFSLYKLEDLFQKLPIHWMWWPALGGLVIGIGGYFQPRALGVGYDVIGDLLNGHIAMTIIFALLIVKLIIWIFALASGTSGGVLAPLLIFGCCLGTIMSFVFPATQTPGVWALIGMGAIMGGMMRAPLTSVIFCYELTKDSEIFLPLVIASTIAYAFTVYAMKRSILTEKVARRGYDIFREYSVDPLEKISIKDVFSVNIVQKEIAELTVYAEESCRVAADRMALHNVTQLHVLSSSHEIIGIVTLTDLLKARKLHYHEESHREKIFV